MVDALAGFHEVLVIVLYLEPLNGHVSCLNVEGLELIAEAAKVHFIPILNHISQVLVLVLDVVHVA